MNPINERNRRASSIFIEILCKLIEDSASNPCKWLAMEIAHGHQIRSVEHHTINSGVKRLDDSSMSPLEWRSATYEAWALGFAADEDVIRASRWPNEHIDSRRNPVMFVGLPDHELSLMESIRSKLGERSKIWSLQSTCKTRLVVDCDLAVTNQRKRLPTSMRASFELKPVELIQTKTIQSAAELNVKDAMVANRGGFLSNVTNLVIICQHVNNRASIVSPLDDNEIEYIIGAGLSYIPTDALFSLCSETREELKNEIDDEKIYHESSEISACRARDVFFGRTPEYVSSVFLYNSPLSKQREAAAAYWTCDKLDVFSVRSAGAYARFHGLVSGDLAQSRAGLTDGAARQDTGDAIDNGDLVSGSRAAAIFAGRKPVEERPFCTVTPNTDKSSKVADPS